MSIYEYNEEYARKTFFEEGQEEGYSKGVADGKKEGRAEALLNSIHRIMESLELEIDKACELLGVSVEEYELISELMDAEKSIREEDK